DFHVTGVQTCALPICPSTSSRSQSHSHCISLSFKFLQNLTNILFRRREFRLANANKCGGALYLLGKLVDGDFAFFDLRHYLLQFFEGFCVLGVVVHDSEFFLMDFTSLSMMPSYSWV